MPIVPLAKFIRASDALVKFEANFSDLREEMHTVFILKIQGEELRKLWDKVQSSHEQCLDYLAGAGKSEPEDAEVVSNKYQTTYMAYITCMATIDEKMHNCERHSNPKVSDSSTANYSDHNLTLPPCDVKTFDGDYVSWPAFRDLFTAIYVNSSRLSNIERLCHLIRKTAGEANEIVSKCPLSNDGFEVAWKLLREAYENPRMLVNNQLKLLFNLPSVEKESSAGLKSLQRGITNCLNSLSQYKVPTDNWDPILIFMCIQRLPTSTVSLWEQGVRDKSGLSKWKDFDAFLTERIQTLECINDLKSLTTSGKAPVSQKTKVHVVNANSAPTSCVFCRLSGHFLRNCRKFRNLSLSERFSAVKKLRCCVNCLSREHEVKNCKSAFNCTTCNKRHHSLLHRDVSNAEDTSRDNSASFSGNMAQNNANSSLPSTSNGVNPPLASNRQVFHAAQTRRVLLGTAMVNIVHQGMTYPARALIDPASESSFISERFQNRLKLLAHSTNVKVSGVNQTVSATIRKVCALKISSHLDQSLLLETTALILPNISGNLPSFVMDPGLRENFLGLQLADPHFSKSRQVDLLLGADLYSQIILGEIKRDPVGSLIAQKTVFGWIITGSIAEPTVRVYSTKVEFSMEDKLNKNLLRFWELEEAPKRKIMTLSDKLCEENFRRTTRRNSEGRYVVTLPFKTEFPQLINLGFSRRSVMAQFLRNEASLLRKPDIKTLYDNVVNEYLILDHMKPISDHYLDSSVSCYLPHHPVIKPERKTTKLRVVFNASNKTSNGNSLNDCLYVGPTLQADLVLLILRWRLYRYVYNCDITQMYRQILLDPSHTPYQRILFRSSPTEEVKTFELQTVTFGVNCAPYLALRTLLQLADDSEHEYPLAANILRKSMYVDDVLTGAHDIPSALKSRDQLRNALSSAKFELRKWTSNEKELLRDLPSEHLVDSKLLTFVESSSSKPLGILWNAQLDAFYFRTEAIVNKPNYTKREVLSTIAKLFDPVGWLGPVIIIAKIIMQRIWQDNIDWDDFLLPSTEIEWKKFVGYYGEVNNIQIPRWVRYEPGTSAEIHVFSDASEKAYAGVLYLRVETCGRNFTHLLLCKTKVAPIKTVSLPRLELCGAVLASELVKTVVKEIDIPLQGIYCWTDSTIVLCWLKKTPSTWTTFVANRVCRIHENVGSHNWFHVRSEENPADLGSRGLSPAELAKSKLWWYGPNWLRADKSCWSLGKLPSLDTDIEAKAIRSHTTTLTAYEDILVRFSKLDRAFRVIAYIFRFFHRTHFSHKGKYTFTSMEISGEEITKVKLRLAILAQKTHYPDEYLALLSKGPISRKSSLKSLNPFLDCNGVMRLNGRLGKSPSLSYTEKFPIILPYSCRFTVLLAEFVHLISIHGGNQLMLRIIRIEYWVPRLKILVRSIIHRCKRCLLDRKRSCSQIMAALPPERTTLDRPFTTTGVDFAGPFDMKSFKGRSCRIIKGYVCIFVCFSTKAVHLEATSDLTSDTFLAAFHRFISRRGCPQTVFSDNGTNFVGASNEIERDFRTFMAESKARMCSTFGIQGLSWRFIPAGAPHMGGLWEAAVKSFKLHFRKEIQNAIYTFEELSTILARIEACLNSRPLCPMSDNPNDPVALTPGHFLIGCPILAPPEPSMLDTHISILNRYRKIKAFSHEFCRRWKEEYLQNLHKRYKWQFPERNIEVDDLVAIRHEQLSPTSWKLGRVIRTYPGSDDHVRVVDIQTANGVVKRPITKLVVLKN